MKEQLKAAETRLQLKPVRGVAMPVGQFLKECSQHPEASDSVWDRLVNIIKAGGTLKPTDRYLRALRVLGIDSYRVFEDIRGSERTIHEIFSNPLRDQMLILLGPPGSGKTKITERVSSLLRGQQFYVIEGCPQNEQAINLLRFFRNRRRSPRPRA